MTGFQATPLWEEFPTARISEVAHPDRCAKCKSALWITLSDWICAFTLYLDPEPLTTFEEVAARLAGVRIWQAVNRHDGTFTIARRTLDRIQKSTGNEIVLGEHRCDLGNIRMSVPTYWPKFRFPDTGEVPF